MADRPRPRRRERRRPRVHPHRPRTHLVNQCRCCGDPCRGEVCTTCFRIINPRRESQ
ncbi:hypothetical protein SEA_ENALISNAILO_48 [Gordonia phage EnalisNailo]|nr:hypothetical protein SEA_ENALISNAILO_48 [Gordonia phage EnalisNailo]